MQTRPVLLSLLLMLIFVAGCTGQSAPAANPSEQTQSVSNADDLSGMYEFLREGEFVQVTLEDGQVTGFVSRYGDSASDKGAFLDQFFSKAALDGNKLTFTTKPVHDLWYEFAGTIDRGTAKAPTDEGYRVLRGKLTQFTTDASKKVTSKTRDVEFKSFPKDADDTQ